MADTPAVLHSSKMSIAVLIVCSSKLNLMIGITNDGIAKIGRLCCPAIRKLLRIVHVLKVKLNLFDTVPCFYGDWSVCSADARESRITKNTVTLALSSKLSPVFTGKRLFATTGSSDTCYRFTSPLSYNWIAITTYFDPADVSIALDLELTSR